MTSTIYTSNNRSSGQSVFKSHINFSQNIKDSKPSSRFPSFANPNHLNNVIFISNITNNNFQDPKPFNSVYSHKSEQDSEYYAKPFFPILNKNWPYSFLEFPNQETYQNNRNFDSKLPNFVGLDEKNFKFESKYLLNFAAPENEKDKSKTKNDNFLESNNEKYYNQTILKNNIIRNDNNIFNNNEQSKLERNMEINLNTSTNKNMGTKFFTNHNYGYKCSCSKTQCNRKYCECYNSGNYCIDCNCKNCKNQPPINTYSNKRPNEIVSKMKKSKEMCTCIKSACNNNYCECFKRGNKCITSLCRCIGCENTEDNIKLNNKSIYECCRANSIYILKNKIYIENIKTQKQKNIMILEACENNNEKIVNKKRKRDEIKKFEEFNFKRIKKEKNLCNDSLFDENGKLILKHISYDQLLIL